MSVSEVSGKLSLVSPVMVETGFDGALAPFKEKVFALDNAEVARAVLEGVGKLTGCLVIDPTDGMRYYFNGLALPEELMESLELLDGYVKQQTSEPATKQLKKDMKVFERELTCHVQEKFKSCDDLLVIARQLEASGQKQAAVCTFYGASLKALEDSEPEKLELAVGKIEELDPTMASLDLQQRTQLKAQMTIIGLRKELAPLKEIEKYGFGPANWAKYFGDVGEVPPLPPKLEEILQAPCPYWKEKRVRDTHMLVLVPATVNGEPFTLNSLGEMIQTPKSDGNATNYRFYWEDAKEELGDKAFQHSYWTLIVKDVIPKSQGKQYKYCEDVLAATYNPPKVLEAATAILMHYTRTGERLFSRHNSYIWCEERVEKAYWNAALGGFLPEGLDFPDDCDRGYLSCFGLGAARRF
jgi:hypothetical protein